MEEKSSAYLIVGLGNPGKEYQETRHNFGFLLLRAFAREHSFVFSKQKQLKGELAQGKVSDKKVYLFMPTTYMNLSGSAVRLCIDYYKIALSHFLVISDEIYLPFGKYRFRPQGSSGGHKGLESIEDHLKTRAYSRLRIGVGEREHGNLADHVLGKFSQEEKDQLPTIMEEGIRFLEKWVLETN